MEIIVKGRNTEVSERFRSHLEDKLQKVEQYAPTAQRVEVTVQKRNNPSRADEYKKIELTVIDKGPVIRAEAEAQDQYSAFDMALTKLVKRLRRARDRRKSHGRNNYHPAVEQPLNVTVDELKNEAAAPETAEAHVVEPHKPEVLGEAVEVQVGDSPVIVRDKLYEATPMSVDQALYEMEMVGHPFYLFIDEETNQPCAVYLRHGYTYGVIRLDARVK